VSGSRPKASGQAAQWAQTMDKLKLETLADRIVAWHNRHPLARRIAAAQLQSVGYVALPFRAGAAQAAAAPSAASGVVSAPASASPEAAAEAPPTGGSLRERAMARARQGDATASPPAATTASPPAAATSAPPAAATGPDEPAFAEDVLAPLRRVRVARWALQHAPELAAEPRDAPVRRVDAQGGGSVRQRYALTALIEVDGQRSRVLVGAGETAPVLGQRLLSRPRLAAAAGLALGLPALGVAALLLLGGAGHDAAPAAQAAASAAVRVAGADPASPTAGAPQPGAPVGVAVPALRPQLAPAAAAASEPNAATPAHLTAEGRPVDVEPQLGRIDLPGLGLPRGERTAAPRPPATAAPAPVVAAASGLAAPPPPPPPARAPEPVAPAPPPATTAAAPPAPVAAAAGLTPQPGSFAVSTRLLRTRAESEQVMQAMQALLEGMGARDARVDIVAHGDDWRVIGWPFARRQDADRARALLASRGMRVEVLVF